uniref:Uncharacterized protein n=1 Tax=Brassica oleracea var. oleracea TaxID=109376 RepID=A0A0D3BVY9_BRAOL
MATKLLSLTCIRKERFTERYPVLRKHLNRSRGGGDFQGGFPGFRDDLLRMRTIHRERDQASPWNSRSRHRRPEQSGSNPVLPLP